MSWETKRIPDKFGLKQTVHVFPPDEWYIHQLYDHSCQCAPKIRAETDKTHAIVIHNSWDGREKVEVLDKAIEKFAEERTYIL